MRHKRAHVRVRPSPQHPIEVQIVGAGFMELVTARDISEGGIAVHIPHSFEGIDIAAEVDLIITLPSGRAFSAKGQIRYLNPSGPANGHFGVQFTQLSPNDRARIASYVKQRADAGGAC